MYSDDLDEEVEKEGSGNKFLDFYNANKKMVLILLGLILIIVVLAIASSCSNRKSETVADVPVLVISTNSVSVAKNNTVKVSANITNIAGAVLSWESSDSNIATVDNQGLVTGVNYGNAVIKAYYLHTDGKTYEITCNVKVASGDENIKLTDVSFPDGSVLITIGNEYTIPVILEPSLGYTTNISYRSTNKDVVTVDDNGRIKAVSAGKAIIGISVNDGAFTDEIVVEVTKNMVKTGIVIKPTSFVFNDSSLEMTVGNTLVLSYQYFPLNADVSNLTWESSDSSIVSVNSSGKITSLAFGEATISVKDGTDLLASVDVLVQNSSISVSSIDVLSNKSLQLALYQTSTIIPNVLPADATNKSVTYSSSNNVVATVDGNGIVTAVGIGNCVINLTTNDGGKKTSVYVSVSSSNSSDSSGSSSGGSDVGYISITSNVIGSNGTKVVEQTYSASIANYSTTDVIVSFIYKSSVTNVKYCTYIYGQSACTPSIDATDGYTMTLSSDDTYVIRYIKYNDTKQSTVQERFVTIKSSGSSSSSSSHCYLCSNGTTSWGTSAPVNCNTVVSNVTDEPSCKNYSSNSSFAFTSNNVAYGSTGKDYLATYKATYGGEASNIKKLYICYGYTSSCTVNTSSTNQLLTNTAGNKYGNNQTTYLVNSSSVTLHITNGMRIGIIAVNADGTKSNQKNYIN